MSRTSKVIGLLIGNGINTLLSFLLVPYLARALSLGDYGTYGQVLMIIGFCVTFLGFGLDKVLFAYFADQNIEQSDTLKSNIIIVFIFGIMGTLFVLFTNKIIGNQFENVLLPKLLTIYCFSVPFHLLYNSLNSTLIYFSRIRISVVISIATNILRLALIFVFIQLFFSLSLVFLSLAVIPVIQCLLSYFAIPEDLRSVGAINKSLVISQIKVGIPLGLTVIVSTIFTVTDGFMVSKLLDVDQYALFRNGATYIPIVASIYASVNTIILPDISRLYNRGDIREIISLKNRALKNTAAIIYPVIIFFIVFAHEIIPLLLSEKYAASWIVFSIFNCILFFRVTSYTDVYIASKRNFLLPRKYVISAALNLILNYVFIRIFGIEGAAMATAVSFALLVFLLFRGCLQILSTQLNDLVPLRELLNIFLIPSMVCIISLLLYHTLSSLPLLIALFVVYLLLVYHHMVKNNYLERSILRSLLGKYEASGHLLRLFNHFYPGV